MGRNRRYPPAIIHLISDTPVVMSAIQGEDEAPLIPHALFQSPKDRDALGITPEIIWDAAQLAPFDRLPRAYINTTVFPQPHQPGDWAPPRFHYGWRPNIDRLLAFAHERGLTATYSDDLKLNCNNYPQGLLPRPMHVEYLYDIDFDEQGCRVQVPQPATRALWPHVDKDAHDPAEIDVYNTIRRALQAMAHELRRTQGFGIWCHRNTFRVVNTLRQSKDTNLLVTVMSNDYLTEQMEDCIPSQEEMDKLAHALGVTGKPRWYVDRDVFEWRDMYYDEHTGAEERQHGRRR